MKSEIIEMIKKLDEEKHKKILCMIMSYIKGVIGI